MDKKVVDFAKSRGYFNPLHYGAAEEKCVFETQAAECGYKRLTTFFSDLSIAEWYGLDSVRDTFNRVMKEWLGDYKYITEFILSLNWKSWEWAVYGGRNYEELSNLYVVMYGAAEERFYEYYKDNEEAKSYYFRVTD